MRGHLRYNDAATLFCSLRRNGINVAQSRLFHRPVNVAFFGSDHFSVYSLHKIITLKHFGDDIGNIDVITRKPKPKGRYGRSLHDFPVGVYAENNGVLVLRADDPHDIIHTLMDNDYDLAIAVSYGQLIPGKFIKSLTYGGLNVHPSLLPRYAGSSPIQHALMNDDSYTGVTVQTLHPTKFDHGSLIAQSDAVPIQDSDDYGSLESRLGEIGGQLLHHTLKEKLYVDVSPITNDITPSSATKIHHSTKEINWNSMSSRTIKRYFDALGPLYTFIFAEPLKKKKSSGGSFKRVILQGINVVETNALTHHSIGSFMFDPITNSTLVKTIDGEISVKVLTFECCQSEEASIFHQRLPKRIGNQLQQFSKKQ